jgi:hypothetical protein
VLTVQPVVLSKLASKKAFSGNGTLERFLYVLPKSKLGYRTHDKPPVPAEVTSRYKARIRGLLEIPVPDDTLGEQTNVLTLSDEALLRWRKFQNQVEVYLRPDGKLNSCLGWGGKISGFALRIAGLLHVVRVDDEDYVIDELTMFRAIYLAERLIDHAVIAYGMMGTNKVHAAAKFIYCWIQARRLTQFTQTEVTEATKNVIEDKEERSHALSELIDRNIISKALKIPTPRKTTIVYRVNPAVHGTQEEERVVAERNSECSEARGTS